MRVEKAEMIGVDTCRPTEGAGGFFVQLNCRFGVIEDSA